MSTVRLIPAEPVSGENRRSNPRRRLERLAYIRFDNDNGGILIDVGEGGLKFHGVASSAQGELCVAKFTLPGTTGTIEVRGQIVWSNSSRKGGGVRFLDLSEEARLKIRAWMSQENVPRVISKPGVSEPAATTSPVVQTPAREDVANSSPAAITAVPAANNPLAGAEVPVECEDLNSRAPAETIAEGKPPEAIPESGVENVSEPVLTLPSAEDSHLAHLAAAVSPARSAEFPRSESVFIVDLGKNGEQSDRPNRGTRAAQIFIVAASVGVIALAAVVGISRSSAVLSALHGISETARPSPASAVGTVQDFRVDAVDIANRRWILQNRPNDSAAPNDGKLVPSPAQQDGASRIAAAPSESGSFESASIAAHMDLHPPTLRQAPSSPIALDAPRLSDGASSTGLLDSRALGASAPQLPLPVPAPVSPAASSARGFREPVLIHSVQATYPGGTSASYSGAVLRVSAVIDADGVPGSLKIVSGDPQLTSAAFGAIRQFRYDPALLDGKAVESTIVITINLKPHS